MDIYKKKKRGFPKDFQKVTNYIKDKRNIRVLLGEETDYQGPFTREILIHHNYDLRNNGLYVLLFECGKALSPFSNPNQFDKETHPREFNWYQYTKDVDAWEIAWDIVCDLDLDINYHKFSSFKYNYLLKYFNNNKII